MLYLPHTHYGAIPMNQIILTANIGKTQITSTKTHYHIKRIPITVNGAVMNSIYYSAEENAKGMNSMVGKPVTLEHPTDGGNATTAMEGVGLDDHYSGGTISKVYNKGDVWFADSSIKKSILNAQDNGPKYAAMLDSKESMSVSTGLCFEDNQVSGTNAKGDSYTKSAINQTYNHLAFLHSDAGAGGKDTIMHFNVSDLMDKPVKDDQVVTGKESGYNDPTPTIINTNDGDLMDRKKIMALLAGKNIAVNADISDADLEAKLTDAVNAKVDPAPKLVKPVEVAPVVNKEDDKLALAINALTAKVDGLETQLAANANAEVDDLKIQMKAMTTNCLADSIIDKLNAQDMKDHLAANGQVAVNVRNGQHHNRAEAKLDEQLPE